MESNIERERERNKLEPQPPLDPSVDSICQPSVTTTKPLLSLTLPTPHCAVLLVFAAGQVLDFGSISATVKSGQTGKNIDTFIDAVTDFFPHAIT